jgi:hypothetical protein
MLGIISNIGSGSIINACLSCRSFRCAVVSLVYELPLELEKAEGLLLFTRQVDLLVVVLVAFESEVIAFGLIVVVEEVFSTRSVQ